MYSVRGATTIELDESTDVLKATEELLNYMIEKNNVNFKSIISVIFSCTRDIKSVYPAKAARDMGLVNAGLFCVQEMYVEGSLERCIRILMFVNDEKNQGDIEHIYLKGAVNLRPDLKRGF